MPNFLKKNKNCAWGDFFSENKNDRKKGSVFFVKFYVLKKLTWLHFFMHSMGLNVISRLQKKLGDLVEKAS